MLSNLQLSQQDALKSKFSKFLTLHFIPDTVTRRVISTKIDLNPVSRPHPTLFPLHFSLCSVSPIYMAKTCLQTGVTSKSGCPSNIVNGTVIGGTTLSSGERTSTSNTTALCNQVFDYGAYEDVSTYLVDSAYVSCAPDYTGYFYIQNNCPSNTTQSTITIQLDYTTSTCSANYKNNWANNWKIVVGVVCGIILLTFLCICVSTIRKKKRMNQMANGVQMMPPPPPQMGSTPIPSQAYSGTPTYTPYNAVPQPPTTYTPSGPKPSGPTSTSYPPPPPGYPQPSYPADTGNAPAVWYKGADNKAP